MPRLSLAPLLATVLAFASPASAEVWTAAAELDAASPFSIEITIDDGAGEIRFAMTGPEDKWFALGLGGSQMSGTYAIVTTPTPAVEERTLGNHNPGSPLPVAVVMDDYVVNGDGTSTFEVSRAQDPGTGAYVFDMQDVQAGVPIPVIWGVGQGAPFQYHGDTRGDGGVEFQADATPAPEGSVVAQTFGATKLLFLRER